MNQTEFVIATAIILFLAFLLGWFCHWVIARLSRASQNDMSELDAMAQALHTAEEERDEALAATAQRERDMASQMAQTEAELSAAMEGLREARREAQELRSYIDRMAQ